MFARLLLVLFTVAPFAATAAQDADHDGVSDPLETKLGMDPRHADAFELIHDDGAKDRGDKNIGSAIELAGDFTRIWFCSAGKNRYVWKIEFAQPWQARSGVATILYVDADNNRATGRQDTPFAQGVDMMLQPGGARMFQWPGRVRDTFASEGNLLYLVADIDLSQENGKSAYRCWLLTQNTAQGRSRDADNMAPLQVTAAGGSQRPRVEVPRPHPLYRPPEIISELAARMVPDAAEPTAEVTWITSWPCNSAVEYGAAGAMDQIARAPEAVQNHRVFIPVKPDAEYGFRATCISGEGPPKSSDVVRLKTDAPVAQGAVQRGEIPLMLVIDPPQGLSTAPLMAGVPFPQGWLGSAANLRVLQDGRELPTQAECACCWPDRTVKWALVQFEADVSRLARTKGRLGSLSFEYGNAVRPMLAPLRPMLVENHDVLVCNTGPLKAVLDKQSFNVFRELSFDKDDDGSFSPAEQLIGGQELGGLYLVDAAGARYVSRRPQEIVIEENGPVRAVVRVRGHYCAQDEAELFEYIVRLMFYRGRSLVRIFHTFGNDNVGQVMTDLSQMGVRLPLALGDDATANGRRGRLELRQMLWDQPPAGQVGSLVVGDKSVQVLAHMVDLREQYPKAWLFENQTLDIQLCPKLDAKDYEADPVVSDRLYYYLRDGVYRFHRGVSKTHEMVLGFARGDAELQAIRALGEHSMSGAVAAPASWCAQTAAAGLMTPRGVGEFEPYERCVEGNFEAFQKLRDRQGEYGMLNFGDWWGERQHNWGNVEYDTQHVMLTEYLRTLDRKFFMRGCEAAIHNRDVDGIHHAAAQGGIGQVYAHCMFHTGDYDVRTDLQATESPAFTRGGFDRGHAWTRGYFDHYFLTGDRRSREWALAVSDHLAGPLTVGFSVGNHAERDTAWPIFGVMAAYEATADPYYLNAARIMVEDVIGRQNPETGNWGFPAGYSKVEPKPIGGYAWCCGLLISSLDLYNRYVGDPRVNQVIVRAARWLVRDEWIAEKQGFRSTSCPTFNANTPPGGACWSCSNALLIAHQLTKESQFLDIGRRGFALFLRDTQAMGKGVTQSICLGPETLWRLKQAGAMSLDPAP